MNKTEQAVLGTAIERLKSGETIDRVLGSIAYENGRATRDTIALELKKLAIAGYDARIGHPVRA